MSTTPCVNQPLVLGQIVELLPEYQDPGDALFTWIVVEEEDRGRLFISPIDTGLSIPPRYPVERSWIRPVASHSHQDRTQDI